MKMMKKMFQERDQGLEMTRLREKDPDLEMTMKMMIKDREKDQDQEMTRLSEKDQDQEMTRLREKGQDQEMMVLILQVPMMMTCLVAERGPSRVIPRLREKTQLAP